MHKITDNSSAPQSPSSPWRAQRQHPFRDLIPGLVVSLAFAFLVGLYGPLEIYFTNIDEFLYDFPLLLPWLLLLFLILLAGFFAAFVVGYLIHPKFYRFGLIAGLVVYVCTYIQGMFFVGHLPPLDGTAILWRDYMPQHIQSVILWVVVAALVLLLWRKLSGQRMVQVVTGVTAFLTAVLLVTGIAVGIANDGFRQKDTTVCTTANEFDLSTKENFIIFLVDATDSASFRYLLEGDDPQFADTLEDFTYYPEMVSTYFFTRDAIPYILHGQWYQNQEDFRSFTTRAYESSPLLNTLKERNYRIGIYEESLVFDSPAVFDIENVRPTEYRVKNAYIFLKAQVRLFWFKYAPFPLKPLVNIDTTQLAWMLDTTCEEKMFSPRNNLFFENLPNQEIVTTQDKCFRFIHLEGAHVPFRYDRDVNLIDPEEGSYLEMVACSMTIVDAYLQKLKDAGVYDNSAIIIMADHGYGFYREVPYLGRANPLFAVKGMGEHHEMAINEAPVSFEDLQEAYVRLLDGAPGGDIFDYAPGDVRPRRVIAYHYGEEEHMEEYYQMGEAWDCYSMIPTGEVYDLDNMTENAVSSQMEPPEMP